MKCVLKSFLFIGNETCTDRNGYGIGSYVILNSGCMSHGVIGRGSNGLSKALCMAVVLFVRPLTENDPLDFTEAWYALNVGEMNYLQIEIISLLNRGVTKHFWVSFQGWV